MTTITAGQLVTAAKINQWCPPGVIEMYGGTVAPSGWFICDGSAISRTTYSDLFTAIGTGFGVGDGSTTFNLPDLRGRVPVGYAPSGGHTDVSTIGANDGQAVSTRRPKHRTSLTDPGHTHSISGGGGVGSQTNTGASGGGVTTSTNTATTGITVGSGNANDALDTPSYSVLTMIIRAKDA